MSTLTVTLPDGRSGSVSLADPAAFNGLSDADKEKTVHEIAGHLQANSGFGADLQAGAHGAMTGLGATATDLGNTAESTIGAGNVSGALQATGKFLTGHAPSVPEGYAAPDVGAAVKSGSLGNIATNVAHAAVAGAPDMAATLGAGLIGGPVAAGGYQAARNLGPIADQRAANNGRAQASPGDVAAAALPAAAIGVAGAAMPAAGRGVVGKIAQDAVAGAGIDQASQLGGSVGTDKGVQDDPMQSVGAGVSAGLTRAATAAPGVITRAVVKPVADNLMARGLEKPASPEDAQSVIRVNKAMDDAKSTGINPRGTPLTDTQVANNVKTEYVANLNGLTNELHRAGLIAASEKSDLQTLINNQALRHNNTIGEGLPGVQSLFDKINDLNLPDEAKTALSNGVRDLNTVSSQSFVKNTTGPFQKLGNLAGQATSVIGGLASGNPLEIVGGIMGHGIAGKIGGAIGAGADRLMGTNTPPVVLQKINAMRALKAAGIDPESSSGLQALQNVRGAVSDVAPQVGAAGRLQAAAEANRQAQADFGDASLRDQATLQNQAAQADALKQKQLDAIKTQAQTQQAQQQANIQASMAAQGKAQQATEKAASSTTDAYLNGAIDNPEADPGNVGRSTASEISDYMTMRRNAAARLKLAQQQARLYSGAQQTEDESAQQTQTDFANAAERDSATLAKQAKQEDAVKQRQIAQMQAQKAIDDAKIQASMDAQGKAQASSDKSKATTIEDFLNGNLPLPEAGPSNVGRSTASEIREYTMRQATAAARLKLAQQQAGAYDKAAGSDVDSLGQAALDKATRANAVKLAMAGSVPSDNPQVPEVAAHAAVQAALLKAQRIMGQAGDLHPDDADALSVGNPASPIPVNRPTGRPPEAAQAPPQAAPLQPQPEAAAPVQAPSRAPWRAYVANGRSAITDDVIDQAMDSLVAQKKLSPKEAQDLSTHQAGYSQDRLRAIQQEAERIAYGPSQGGTQGGNQGYAVEHSAQARLNAANYQMHALAHASANPEHAEGIRNVAMQGKSPAEKTAIAQAYVNAHPGTPAGTFPQWLLNHGRKD